MFLLFHALENELMRSIIFFNFVQLKLSMPQTDIHNIFNLNLVLWGNTAVVFISYQLSK